SAVLARGCDGRGRAVVSGYASRGSPQLVQQRLRLFQIGVADHCPSPCRQPVRLPRRRTEPSLALSPLTAHSEPHVCVCSNRVTFPSPQPLGNASSRAGEGGSSRARGASLGRGTQKISRRSTRSAC